MAQWRCLPEASDAMKSVIRHPKDVVIKGNLSKLYGYWDDLRGDRFAPSWREFDWMRVPTDVIPWCAVVDVKRDPFDFDYRFWGTARTSLQGRDYSRRSVTEFIQKEIATKAFAEYLDVIAKKEPLHITTSGEDRESGAPISYDFLRLPFGENGDVQQILGVGIYDDFQIKTLTNFYGTDK